MNGNKNRNNARSQNVPISVLDNENASDGTSNHLKK